MGPWKWNSTFISTRQQLVNEKYNTNFKQICTIFYHLTKFLGLELTITQFLSFVATSKICKKPFLSFLTPIRVIEY